MFLRRFSKSDNRFNRESEESQNFSKTNTNSFSDFNGFCVFPSLELFLFFGFFDKVEIAFLTNDFAVLVAVVWIAAVMCPSAQCFVNNKMALFMNSKSSFSFEFLPILAFLTKSSKFATTLARELFSRRCAFFSISIKMVTFSKLSTLSLIVFRKTTKASIVLFLFRKFSAVSKSLFSI
ncbi:hypothetical protein MHBO_000168 [Bonamia ostreae]|uniref:Uncharacterized protein n=1 Tax=Bonamia ostreae TaxID=126728 RepID=A0ABV2AFK5_9EUKA